MFTGALIETISTGVAGEKRELSFRDIVDVVRARISNRYGSAGVAPEIHAPRQEEGDITFTPFFVNRAFVVPPETKAEREVFESAIADLDRPWPRTREAAVGYLEELLSSTQSAAFRDEILNKLRTVQQEDDSQRIRGRCKEVLARWPEHSDEGSGDGAGESKNPITVPEPQLPRPRIVTGPLFGVFIALAVMLVGIFSYFYLHSTEQAEHFQNQAPSATNPPLAEPAPLTPTSAQPPPSTVVPSKPLQPRNVVNPTAVSQHQEPAVTPLPGTAATFACEGQTGKVIFEDKFTDDSGGWLFGDGLVLQAPGATIKAAPSDKGRGRVGLNETFNASQGDFCTEISFPAEALQMEPAAGVAFLATDYSNFYQAALNASGKVGLYKRVNTKSSTVWSEEMKNLVKTGPADVNSVRAVVKNGTITVIVNGQTVKSVRALIPSGDLKFGIYGEYNKASATPVSLTFRSYKVTAGD